MPPSITKQYTDFLKGRKSPQLELGEDDFYPDFQSGYDYFAEQPNSSTPTPNTKSQPNLAIFKDSNLIDTLGEQRISMEEFQQNARGVTFKNPKLVESPRM